MCTDTGSTRRRRRSHKEITQASSPGDGTGKVPMAAIRAGASDLSSDDAKTGGFFRSATAKAVLAISAVALIIFSLTGYGSSGGTNVKDLSDAVMAISRQLQNNIGGGNADAENVREELAELRRKLEERDIELSWERQHVAEEHQTRELMHDAMAKEIKREQAIITETTKETSGYARKAYDTMETLHKEKSENAELKVALAFAIEELAKARSQLPPAPGGDSLKYGDEAAARHAEKQKLRKKHTSYQPGDNIEIIEDEEGGKVSLRPGIISEVNSDGTFNLVKLELSIVLPYQKSSAFQTYHKYPPNTPAFFETLKDEYVPVTVLRFIHQSARPGFELHGSYEIMYENGTTGEGQAMRMHRFAGLGEVLGADPDSAEEASVGGRAHNMHQI